MEAVLNDTTVSFLTRQLNTFANLIMCRACVWLRNCRQDSGSIEQQQRQRRPAIFFTYENNGRFYELEAATRVFSTTGKVDVDADLRQVLDPDSDGRHEVRVQPGVSAKHPPPQVDRLEEEGEGADDGEGQEGVDDRILWRSKHQAFLHLAEVSVHQPVADQVN